MPSTDSPKKLIVAIDGPAGAGKSTVARLVAEELHYLRIDTGALYRAVAFTALQEGIALHDGEALAKAMSAANIEMRLEEGAGVVYVRGTKRTDELRSAEVSQAASVVSALPQVREALLDLQRNLGKNGGVVLDGRDIGTVVFPHAELKIFLTANDRERARRRAEELSSRGQPASVDEVLTEMRERDRRDSMRIVAPLKQADDAIAIDSTGFTPEEISHKIAEMVRQRAR